MSDNLLRDKLKRFDNLIIRPRDNPAPSLPEHYELMAESLSGKLISSRSGTVSKGSMTE